LLEYILKAAIAKECKYIFILGDLLDHKVPPREVLLEVHKFLENCRMARIIVVIVRGNHESVSRAFPDQDCILELFSRTCKVVTRDEWVEVDGRDIYCLPYYPRDLFKLRIDAAINRDTGNSSPLLFTHAGLREGLSGSGLLLSDMDLGLEDLCPEHWGLVLLGDFHRPQRLRDNVLYMGSPIQNSFGELMDTYIWILETDDCKLTPIKTGKYFPQFHQLTITDSEPTRSQEIIDKDYYRISAPQKIVPELRWHLSKHKNVEIKPIIEQAPEVYSSRISLKEGLNNNQILLDKWVDHCSIENETDKIRLLNMGKELVS
jgi:DNA repair exonuclease SbcCD nuclease subunit